MVVKVGRGPLTGWQINKDNKLSPVVVRRPLLGWHAFRPSFSFARPAKRRNGNGASWKPTGASLAAESHIDMRKLALVWEGNPRSIGITSFTMRFLTKERSCQQARGRLTDMR